MEGGVVSQCFSNVKSRKGLRIMRLSVLNKVLRKNELASFGRDNARSGISLFRNIISHFLSPLIIFFFKGHKSFFVILLCGNEKKRPLQKMDTKTGFFAKKVDSDRKS